MSDMTPEQVEKQLRKKGDHNHRLAEWFRHERNDKKKAGDSDTHAQNFYDMADTVRRMREREAKLVEALEAAKTFIDKCGGHSTDDEQDAIDKTDAALALAREVEGG